VKPAKRDYDWRTKEGRRTRARLHLLTLVERLKQEHRETIRELEQAIVQLKGKRCGA